MIQVRAMRARSDYILGIEWCRFKILGIRGVRDYPLYHFVLQARLLIYPTESGQHCNLGVPPELIENSHWDRKETRD